MEGIPLEANAISPLRDDKIHWLLPVKKKPKNSAHSIAFGYFPPRPLCG